MNIENTARGYQQLIDEIGKEQEKMNEHIIYLITGIVGAKELSDQEYEVFVSRTLYHNRFEDIGCTMSISESSVKNLLWQGIKEAPSHSKKNLY